MEENKVKPEKKKPPFKFMRQAKHGSTALISILALLGVLILINYIADRESVRWDLTENKKYTLSDQTEKVLDKIDQEVKIIAFFSQQDPRREEVEERLEQYANMNKNIKLEFIDPDIKPSAAKEYGIERYETIIFEMGDKKEEVVGTAESEFTSAILKLTSDEKKKIYFVTGHGERSIEEFSETSYSVIKQALEKENYEVAELSLVGDAKVPDDASVIVIAGTTTSLLPEEVAAVEEYLNNNGRMMFLADPKIDTGVATGLEEPIKNWGVDMKDGFVIDPKNYFMTDPGTPVIEKWETHQITQDLPFVFFSRVGNISPLEGKIENVQVDILANTSPDSWRETNIDSDKVIFDEGQDEEGPLPIAVAIQETATEEVAEGEEQEKLTRIVVVGDSDFAINIYTESLGNLDFFLNAINWLAEDEDLISIRPKESTANSLELTGSQIQFIFYTTVVIMPLTIVVIGIVVFVYRRRLKKRNRGK